MNRSDYTNATNEAKVTAALMILRDMMYGDKKTGELVDQISEITHLLLEVQAKISSSVKFEDDPK